MDLAASLADIIWSPMGAFADIPEESEEDSLANDSETNLDSSTEHWHALNATSETSIDPPKSGDPKWRIDGCDSQGVQFFALPIFLSPKLVPLRVDVFIPDQSKHPPKLRKALNSADAFCVRDQRVAQLGISQLIVNVLEHWTATYDNFEKAFNALPFGSRIIFENVTEDIKQIKVRMIPDYKTERQLLSVARLQEMWKLPSTAWPESISLYDLEHCRQLHDTISLVHIPSIRTEKFFVFKSTVNDAKFLYHELKLLLTMPAHPNVMPRPLFLVTGKDRYSAEDKVYGFVMEYHSQGNLADKLAYRAENGILDLKDQFSWARQIASTLIFINESPARFYSELKADNLILSDGAGKVIFIDFEQMGNWITFSAPEVHYLEYLLKLAKSDAVPKGERQRYVAMVKEHMPLKADPDPIYADSPNGYYRPWISFTPAEQEAAEVFSLGKVLWCIFEGCSDTRNSVLKAFKHDSGLEFPEFRRTPAQIRTLIDACTRGNRDGEPGRVEIVRRGSKVYPRGQSGVNGECVGTATEARETAKLMWQQRVQEMERFLLAKKRWRNGQRSKEDEELLGYPMRPSLTVVLRVLADIESELVKDRPGALTAEI